MPSTCSVRQCEHPYKFFIFLKVILLKLSLVYLLHLSSSVPNVFTKIHISFLLKGDIDEVKAQKAAELAVKKYCSVHDMLAAGGIEITYSIKIN